MENCPFTNLPCFNKKTTHVTEVGANYECVGEKHMCSICGPSFVNSDKDIFVEILTILGARSQERKVKVKKCLNCNFTLEDLIKGEKLGCPTCYLSFKEELKPLIQSLHKATSHIGKKPNNLDSFSRDELKKELDKAVREEKYELAKIIKGVLDKLN